MTNEKDFGMMIDSDDHSIVAAEDLLRLQQPDIHGADPACTVCTFTCSSQTSIIE